MGYCKTQAIALRRGDYSNSSQIVTFYTKSQGKIRVLAKGAKRAERKSPGPIDLFSYMEIIFIQKETGGLHLLTEWEALGEFGAFREDIERFYAACHVARLVCELTEEADENESMFNLLLNTLNGLSLTKYTEIILRAFELQALRLLGYLPQLEECVDCGADLAENRGAVFSPIGNGLLCKRCAGDGARRSLSPGAIRAAVFLAGSSTTTCDRLRLPDKVYEELRSLSQGCIAAVLNKSVEMRKLVT
ncbi:MAG: DNA repair protein RecO [Candidatus Brocadiales bacterium]